MSEVTTLPDINTYPTAESTESSHDHEHLAPSRSESVIALGVIAVSEASGEEVHEEAPGQHFKPNRITSIDVGSKIINPDTAPQIEINRTVHGPDTITTRQLTEQ